ncbi:MAG: hypothetical protein COA50_12795 [Flavobacteriaceae bacterium]|nr:MAG: hypothetical protein COA50_12795 [Flavobacteriaceae bacterium]
MEINKTILATTYAVNPYKGSEDAMGWNFVCQIARFNKVIAITRKNNQVHIERYMHDNFKEYYKNIQFLYFDLPLWQRFWKRGSKGAMLYFWLWQRQIISFVRKQNIHFDIVHNVNFHNDWTPSYLWKLKKPFVWGPIGHHPRIPSQYLKPYKIRYWIKDRLTWLVKQLFWNASISLKKTIKKADFIFCMNSSVAIALNLNNNELAVMPSVASEDFGCDFTKQKKKFTIISAGRLVPLKGYDLSILAFASFLKELPINERNNCELIIIGKGPELSYYKELSVINGVSEFVKFENWMERKDLMQLFKEASVFLFPSHEGAGMVVSEALSFGLPVVCLDNCGPGEFINDSCGFTIPIQEYSKTVRALGDAISKMYQDPKLRLELGKNARQLYEEKFHWNRRGELLDAVYSNIL